MARRLFFVPQVRNGMAEIRGDDAKHLTRVLRVEPGHIYEISDNSQKYLAKVAEAHKESVRFVIEERLEALRESPEITLYAAIIKFEHFEWGIEKATELGVDRIVPLVTARTEKGLEKAVPKRLERWRKIALEASQQSRRAFLPEVTAALPLRNAVASARGTRLFLDEARTGAFLKPASSPAPVAVFLGPEGGWTDDERTLAASQSLTSITLGPRVLRAETAWLACLAILRAEAPQR
jgi:16S rRNA (uracil1498-N3)-methyltransferase